MLLESNEGFTIRTYYKGRYLREERIYTISGGLLHIRAIGKTSWADNWYENEWVASDEEVNKFLYAHQDEMDTDEVD